MAMGSLVSVFFSYTICRTYYAVRGSAAMVAAAHHLAGSAHITVTRKRYKLKIKEKRKKNVVSYTGIVLKSNTFVPFRTHKCLAINYSISLYICIDGVEIEGRKNEIVYTLLKAISAQGAALLLLQSRHTYKFIFLSNLLNRLIH